MSQLDANGTRSSSTGQTDLPLKTRTALPNSTLRQLFAADDDIADCDSRDLLACQYGWYYQAVADVAAAGASVIRQFDNCDLVWRWMFDRYVDDFPIPPPAEIYRMFTEDRLTYLFRFNLMVFACVANGTEIVPTLFTLGGGSSLNDGDLNDSADGAGIGSLDSETMDSIQLGGPYQGRFVIPSAWGWDPFYYDPDEIGAEGGDDNAVTFQQYALSVRPLSRDSGDTYKTEAARRKSMALVAFGLAIGEHLALLDTVFAAWGISITDVVPYLELGNEMSAHWLVPTDEGSSYLNTEGALELGQMMAMLAGPAWSRCQKLRFSVPGLAPWGAPDESVWQERVDWIRRAITDGVSQARTFWSLVRSRETLETIWMVSVAARADALNRFDRANPDVLDWLSTGDAADFSVWPPPVDQPLPDHGNLLHHVGFHWFHAHDKVGNRDGSTTDIADGYAGEPRLLSDIAVFTENLVSNPIDGGILTLSWSLHPAGFPAGKPTTFNKDSSEFSLLGDPMFQAGMVWRLLLVGKAAGAEIVSWHTHIAPIQRRTEGSYWNEYTSMGLRNDLSDTPPHTFRAATDATRRPSWFALRRLAVLLSRTTAVRFFSADDALYVVRLESSSGFGSLCAPELHMPSTERYRYAYVAWLAQDAGHDSGTLRLNDLTSGGYRRLSLAPRVDTSMASGTGDAGYAEGESTTWEWERGSADWTSVADIVSGRSSLTLTVYAASLDDRPVPVCVLTDAILMAKDVSVNSSTRLHHPDPAVFHGWAAKNPATAWLDALRGES